MGWVREQSQWMEGFQEALKMMEQGTESAVEKKERPREHRRAALLMEASEGSNRIEGSDKKLN